MARLWMTHQLKWWKQEPSRDQETSSWKHPKYPTHRAGDWNRQAGFRKSEDIASVKAQSPYTAGRFRSYSDRATRPYLTFYAEHNTCECVFSHAFAGHFQCMWMHTQPQDNTHCCTPPHRPPPPTSLKRVANIVPIWGTPPLLSWERHDWKKALFESLQRNCTALLLCCSTAKRKACGALTVIWYSAPTTTSRELTFCKIILNGFLQMETCR